MSNHDKTHKTDESILDRVQRLRRLMGLYDDLGFALAAPFFDETVEDQAKRVRTSVGEAAQDVFGLLSELERLVRVRQAQQAKERAR